MLCSPFGFCSAKIPFHFAFRFLVLPVVSYEKPTKHSIRAGCINLYEQEPSSKQRILY